MRLDIEQNVAAALPTEGVSVDEFGFPGTNAAEALLKKGIAAAQNGDRDGARKLLTQVVALDPSSEDAWMWLASISDYPEELQAFLKRVLEINPENSRAVEWHAATNTLLAKTLVQRAVAAHNDGSHEMAAQCVAQALAHDANCESAWEFKASLAEDQDTKMECLERVLSINPDNADAFEAMAVIQRAKIEAVFVEAKSYVVDGDSKKAVKLINQYLDIVSDNADAWVLKAHMTNDVEQKMKALENALEADPNHTAARSSYDFLSTLNAPAQNIEPEEVTDPFESKVEEEVPQAADAGAEEVTEIQAAEADEGGTAVEEEPAEKTATEAAEQVSATADEPVRVTDTDEEPVFAAEEESANDQPAEEFAAVEDQPIEAPAEDVSVNYDDGYVAEAPTREMINVQADHVACAFCGSENGAHSFKCSNCQAVTSLSDTENLLANPYADFEQIHPAVMRMESEANIREFSNTELISLGTGHFNLRNYEAGLGYLHEASRRDPNNVVLSSQVNTLAIRVEEINHQHEIDESKPKGKTILVVDDSPTVRRLIAGKLEKSGHNVVCASDGVEALERMGEYMPDLVLLDITMPRMDGYEVCKQIRANPEAQNLPVVMISGKDGFFDKVRGRMAGTTGYVTKPFGPETLMKALETYLLPDAA
jgi:twitching motility two-component system response regulator PilG